MSRRQHTFKQCDVTKAIKATVKAGIAVGRVEIDKDGKIIIVLQGQRMRQMGRSRGKTNGTGFSNEASAKIRAAVHRP